MRLLSSLALCLLVGCTTADVDDEAADDLTGTEPESQTDAGTTGVGDAEIVPISDLSDSATFFSFDGDDAEILWFAVLDGDGGVHVAFDACDVCYGSHLGYDQDGETMVCNNCGNVFDIDGIGTENQGGGCWPGYLPAEVTDTEVIVMHDDLESGSWYFE